MLQLKEALQKISEFNINIQQTEIVNLNNACGRILAEDVLAVHDIPYFSNSAMDGFAINDKFLNQDEFIIEFDIFSGDTNKYHLKDGAAARIFTGAPIPENANMVIMQEHAVVSNGNVKFTKVSQNSNIRKQGEEIHKGSLIINKGILLKNTHIGMLAAQGIQQIKVFRTLKIAIIPTGNEIVNAINLQFGQIFDVNSILLAQTLKNLGFEVEILDKLNDNYNEILTSLQGLSEKFDVLLTTGGVSVGEKDLLKDIIKDNGILHFWKVAIQPGKPVAFGEIGKSFWFGLPGNPNSAYVCLLNLVLPFLWKSINRSNYNVQQYQLSAGFEFLQPKDRMQFLGAHVVDNKVLLNKAPSSAAISFFAQSTGFVIVNEGEIVNLDDLVYYVPFVEYLS